jgi:hypothetical protein
MAPSVVGDQLREAAAALVLLCRAFSSNSIMWCGGQFVSWQCVHAEDSTARCGRPRALAVALRASSAGCSRCCRMCRQAHMLPICQDTAAHPGRPYLLHARTNPTTPSHTHVDLLLLLLLCNHGMCCSCRQGLYVTGPVMMLLPSQAGLTCCMACGWQCTSGVATLRKTSAGQTGCCQLTTSSTWSTR